MIKYLSVARKIHRFLVLIVASLSLIMAFTGLLLKYPSFKLNFLDLGMIRYIHNQLSPWLTVTLFLMAFSGILMYFSHWSKKS